MTPGRRRASERRPRVQKEPSHPPGGIQLLDDYIPAKKHGRPRTSRRLARALLELVRSHRRLAHVPILMQIRALAHFEGREPCSYVLDPAVKYVPELPLGVENPACRHGLCFTGRDPHSGRPLELVTLPDGCAFDLPGIAR
jgi:hypothetical protein